MKKSLRFSIDIIPEEDGQGYYVVVPALPGCFSHGKTVEAARRNIEEAITLHISEMKRLGEPIPEEGTSYQSIIEIAA